MIPTARRAAYSAFPLASPRLMEPVLAVGDPDARGLHVRGVQRALKRRGHVVADAPKPGTPVYTVKALLRRSIFRVRNRLAISQARRSGRATSTTGRWCRGPAGPVHRAAAARALAGAQHLARVHGQDAPPKGHERGREREQVFRRRVARQELAAQDADGAPRGQRDGEPACLRFFFFFLVKVKQGGVVFTSQKRSSTHAL